MNRFAAVCAILFASVASPALACETPVSVCGRQTRGSFALVREGRAAQIHVDRSAGGAVRRVARDFARDLERLGATDASLLEDVGQAGRELVIIGVLGRSPVIDDLVRRKRIDMAGIDAQWEAFSQVVVEKPFPNVPRALLVVGADRRGAVFGTYDLSEKIGVSPWYWWADVPIQKKSNVFITAGERTDQPKVKYRGFFINDEEPAFGNWARATFGAINAQLYERVFELLLRLKGNYLWPAMWGKAFNDDDPRNMTLADEMGVIMGTSHHEPMMRAQAEWKRNTDRGVTGGAWDYTKNAANLRAFWRGGIERLTLKGAGQAYDSLVTVGMRGDGDEPMTQGTATALLESIVSDQRRLIAEVTGKPASETPQVWALYKEVQDYFDAGMQVPDDVMLLFADDNWGQIRRLPVADKRRKGGYGVYYHFDYVGGPRNYKWLNTNQIEKVWQQMNLAYDSGADDLWIVNVGDIKPMEFPLSFFMGMAWNPAAMDLDAMSHYAEKWAGETFGPGRRKEIADLITKYSKLAARRKPELLDAHSFSLSLYETPDISEFEARIREWQALEDDAKTVRAALHESQRDAYFQIVEHPILALSNLYRLYYIVARNHHLAASNDPRANAFASAAESAYQMDQQITDRYHALKGGKWRHMMSQTHIGYTNWQQPPEQRIPRLERVVENDKGGASVAPPAGSSGRLDAGGYISIDAPNYSRAVNGRGIAWRTIPNLGRTLGAVTAFPQPRPTTKMDNVRLEFDLELRKPATTSVHLYMVPTLDVAGSGGIRIGVSLDDGPIETLTMNLIPDSRDWSNAVRDNAFVLKSAARPLTAGRHTVKVWRLDGNAVLQKLIVDLGGLASGYLGPPQNVATKH